MGVVSKVLLGGELDREVLSRAERSTLMVIDDPLRQLSSFFLRLVAAAIVATGGIAADSATTIIGAMLIAPLMSPMLGCALATAQGRPLQALRTFGLVVLGMGVVLAVSIGVTALLPVAADMATNSQVLSRISPRLVDLVIALAAGFIAALASMRSDIPDAVPGVAISASIVPPLCVVGAGIYEGAPAAAAGAMFLFVTNFVAIQVTGSAVYLLMGLGSRRFSEAEQQMRELWYAGVAVAVVVIGAVLLHSSQGVIAAAERERAAQDAVSEWLDGTGWRVTELSVDGDDLFLQIAGSGDEPGVRSLDGALEREGAGIDGVSLSVVEEHRVG